MKHLIPLMKRIELILRSGGQKDETTWADLAELTDWDYRIIQDFETKVNYAIKQQNSNFIYKVYEKISSNEYSSYINNSNRYDLIIAVIKRTPTDLVLTDVWRELELPTTRFDYIEFFGMPEVQAKNMAIEKALQAGAKKLLIVNHDIIAPVDSLMIFWEEMIGNETPVVMTDDHKLNFALIDLEKVCSQVSMPYFWELPNLSADKFFIQNLEENFDNDILFGIRNNVKLLRLDKDLKRLYGEKDKKVRYATSNIENYDQYQSVRTPKSIPKVLVGIPRRTEKDPIAVDLTKMQTYKGMSYEPFFPVGLAADAARETIAQMAVVNDFDYLLFIDNDIVPPIDGALNLMLKMKETDADIVAGYYEFKGGAALSVHMQIDNDGVLTQLNHSESFKEGGLVESNWLCGLAFSLIKVDIFKQMKRPWFKLWEIENNIPVGEDAHFSEMCFINGCKILIDTSINCLHVDFNEKKLYGRKMEGKYATFPEILKFEFNK